jgi:hypothetical protein
MIALWPYTVSLIIVPLHELPVFEKNEAISRQICLPGKLITCSTAASWNTAPNCSPRPQKSNDHCMRNSPGDFNDSWHLEVSHF